MADQIIQFEGTEHHFPADFSQAEISKALSSAHPLESKPIAQEENPSLVHEAVKYSPIGMVQALAQAIRDPKHAIAGILDAPQQNAKILDKAKESYGAGDYTGAAAHFLNYLMPGGGAMEDAGEDFQRGDHARGVAKTLGIASNMFAGKAASKALDVATDPELAAQIGEAAGKTKDAVVAGVKAAAPDVAKGTAQIAAGAALPKIPGVSYGLEYQGGKQILKGLKAGVQGGRAALAARIAKAAAEDKILAPDVAASMLESLNEDDVIFHPPAQAAPSAPATAPIEAPELPFTPAGPVRPPLAGNPVAAADPVVEAAPVIQPKTDLEDLLERSLKDPHIARTAITELDEHLKQEGLKKAGEIIGKNQMKRALKLGRFLQTHGMTTEHVSGLTPAEWHEIGGMADVAKPSATTIQKTIDLMRMGEENSSAAGAGR